MDFTAVSKTCIDTGRIGKQSRSTGRGNHAGWGVIGALSKASTSIRVGNGGVVRSLEPPFARLVNHSMNSNSDRVEGPSSDVDGDPSFWKEKSSGESSVDVASGDDISSTF